MENAAQLLKFVCDKHSSTNEAVAYTRAKKLNKCER